MFLRTGPPPPLEWTSFPPLLTAVSITLKGAKSSGSRFIGEIGALVYFFHPRSSRINSALSSRPGSALRHREVADSPGEADSGNARACPQKTANIDGLHYSPDDPNYGFGLSVRLSLFELRETGD